jgi:hypothetical protein
MPGLVEATRSAELDRSCSGNLPACGCDRYLTVQLGIPHAGIFVGFVGCMPGCRPSLLVHTCRMTASCRRGAVTVSASPNDLGRGWRKCWQR